MWMIALANTGLRRYDGSRFNNLDWYCAGNITAYSFEMKYILSFIASALLLGCSSNLQSGADIDVSKTAVTSEYDSTVPDVSEHMMRPAVLSFSKTRGWRHEEGIAGLSYFLIKLTREKGYGVFSTENAAIFNDRSLADFKLIVLNNATGNSLSENQKNAVQRWLEAGGAILALHGAGDGSQDEWPWYQKQLIGPKFIGHPADPQFQDARIEMLDANHPIAEGIPPDWKANDEWYSFDGVPDSTARIIAGLDESTYSPVNTVYGDVSDLRMGEGAASHPIIWSRCIGEGRFVYSALGHQENSYNNSVYAQLLSNAFDWAVKTSDEAGKGC